MAVVQSVQNMNTKMYTLVQQHQDTNCVILTTGIPQQNNQQNVNTKSVIVQQQSGKRPLVPAPERTTSVVVNNNVVTSTANNDTMLRCKRKINFAAHVSYGMHTQPASVARRNARERNRVKQVNNGFATLRQHIPASVAAAFTTTNPTSNSRSASKKLSKVETLRMAVEYIRALQQVLDEHEANGGEVTSTMNYESGGGIKSEVGSTISTDSGKYYDSSPEMTSQHQMQMLRQGQSIIQHHQTPPPVSPTPSYSSEGSLSTPSTYTSSVTTYRTDSCYEPMSPEDEELLDVISWWQQQ